MRNVEEERTIFLKKSFQTSPPLLPQLRPIRQGLETAFPEQHQDWRPSRRDYRSGDPAWAGGKAGTERPFSSHAGNNESRTRGNRIFEKGVISLKL